MTRILFVCSQNRLRSPTAEQTFAGRTGLECSSAGTNRDAENPLTAELVEWAEVVFVMEREHKQWIAERFSGCELPAIEVLDIPDEYELMAPELVEMLRAMLDLEIAFRSAALNQAD